MDNYQSLACQAAFAVFLTLGFYLLALAMTALLLYIPYAIWAYGGHLNIKLLLFCVIGAGVIFWSIIPRFDHLTPHGPRLDGGWGGLSMRKWRVVVLLIALISCLLLAGCGGGGGNSNGITIASKTVSGVAAAGIPIIGTIYLQDSSSSWNSTTQRIATSAQINSDGSYSLDVSDLTPPFLLTAVGTVNGQSCTLYSLAGGPGVANINPLTNLAVVQATLSPDARNQTSNSELYSQFVNVIPQIQTLLQQLLTQYGAAATNFVSDAYSVNHTGLDLMFDVVAITITPNTSELNVTNKLNGAVILSTVLNGTTLNGQVIAANIPVIANQNTNAVYVYPASILISAGETVSFRSIVIGTANQDVTWSVVETDGGNITPSGVYTPAKPGVYHVKATSILDTSQSYIATVSVYLTDEYTIPTAGSGTNVIITGPDGNLWFAEGSGNKIGKITTSGIITEYAIPTIGCYPTALTSGPDGNLWFIESNGNKIGKITTTGMITEYAIPTANSSPGVIISGPDGNLWFTEQQWANKIGKITRDGIITEYAIPTTYSEPGSLVSGPDGNIWFTEGSGKIGKITPAGVFTEYVVPTPLSFPHSIISGPDGNLWFVEGGRTNKIGNITTSGVFTEFTIPEANSSPGAMIFGPDGNLWLVDGFGDAFWKITTAGVFTAYPLNVRTNSIISGTDGYIWFAGEVYSCIDTTCEYQNRVGKLTTTGTIIDYYVPSDLWLFGTFVLGPDGNPWFTDRNTNSIGVVRD